MNKYDAIIVLASQPDEKTWKFPKQIYKCLDRTAQLLKDGKAKVVITSGDHSTSLQNRGITQPFRECDKMAEYLIDAGVPHEKILREGDSRDTISNLYFMKKQFLLPRKMKNLLFVVADFRIPRLKFLCEKVLGPDYLLKFEAIKAPQGKTYNETHTMKVQQEFLSPMKSGDHAWLDGKFFTAPMYQYWAKHDREKYNLK